jgi:hypothetical protein
MPYIRSLAVYLYPWLFIYCFTILRYLFSNIILLPLYRSLPYRGVRSYCIASAVLNSDGSNSYAAISRRLIKE